jgi:modulator of FtsH protease HflK
MLKNQCLANFEGRDNMPWNKDDDNDRVSQGPWGQGAKGPRNTGGGNNGGGGGGGNRGPSGLPPEIDDLLRKGKDSLKNALPQGAGRGTWLLPVAGLLAFWAFMSVYQVQPDENGMVLRLGAYSRTATPGLHFAVWPVERMEMVRVESENQTDIGDSGDEGLMLTGDENMVDIKFKVLWKINDAQKYLFNVQDPQEQLVRSVAESAMREIVGRTTATDALTSGKLAIQEQVIAISQKTLDSYDAGVLITGLTLENVDPPPSVLDAFEEVQRAKQNQVNLINQAEQYSNQTLREADGQTAKISEDAKGYKARVVNESLGESQRFLKVYEEYAKAKDVTRERMYLETMEEVLSRSNKVILQNNQNGNGVVPYLPLPALTMKKEEGVAQ